MIGVVTQEEEWMQVTKGILYGVSVGPGDPELMTLKAVRILKAADVIALPHSRKESCTAYQIAVQAVPEIAEKEILPIAMPMTRETERLQAAHQNGTERVIAKLEEGKTIAFLTLGDVTVYSSCQYIYQRVRERGYAGELISGVPSFCAAAARLDRALVCGGEPLHILPVHTNLEAAEALDGVKVLMKPGKDCSQMKKYGKRICGVANCGMAEEKIYCSGEEIPEKQGYYTLFFLDEKKEIGERE